MKESLRKCRAAIKIFKVYVGQSHNIKGKVGIKLRFPRK